MHELCRTCCQTAPPVKGKTFEPLPIWESGLSPQGHMALNGSRFAQRLSFYKNHFCCQSSSLLISSAPSWQIACYQCLNVVRLEPTFHNQHSEIYVNQKLEKQNTELDSRKFRRSEGPWTIRRQKKRKTNVSLINAMYLLQNQRKRKWEKLEIIL